MWSRDYWGSERMTREGMEMVNVQVPLSLAIPIGPRLAKNRDLASAPALLSHQPAI